MLSKQPLFSPRLSGAGLLLLAAAALASLAACDRAGLLPFLASPTPTATVTPTATPTPTPTPTPSPTPQPIVRVQEGDHALFNGDWNQALSLYKTALDQQPATDVAAAARFGVATTLMRSGHLAAAAGEFTLFLQAHPTDPRVPEATFQLGAIAQAQGEWGLAVQHYQKYLVLRPGVIDSYVWERIGRSNLEWGNYHSAAGAYEQAILADRAGGMIGLIEKKAEALGAQGDLAGALALYNLVANSTDSRTTLARMDILRGRVELQRGNTELAYAHFRHAVDNYPEAYDAYQSLIALVDAGVPVDELQRGIIDYNAGAHAAALAAFDRYLASTDAPDARAFYYAALTHRALGRIAAALQRFQDVIDRFPGDPVWDDAWTQKAYTQWAWADDYGGAVDTLTRFAAAAPDHPSVPAALHQAGRIAERQNNLARAAAIWAGINAQYPASPEAPEGAFLAGVALFRQGNYASAVGQFEIAANHSMASAERRAAAWMWVGKVQRVRGDQAAAEAALDQAMASDPGGYYSLRAAELKAGLAPFRPAQGYDLSIDWPREQVEAEAWLAEKLGIPNPRSLGQLSPTLAADGRWVRGREMWTLGLSAEAKAEFDQLRRAYSADALALYQIALALRELGAYSSAIRAARGSLDALGLADTFSAPAFFTHLRFGPYYSDLILKAARDYDFDPLLLYAVVRQESLFEGAVTSAAAAQGLMQIIPPTGEWIAGRLNWPNYRNSDLFRPYISLEFGAYYLAYQRQYLRGDLHAALAAYNAGPGNAEIWHRLSGDDPDLFLEIVRLDEPRRYIRGIFEFYYIYRGLYGT